MQGGSLVARALTSGNLPLPSAEVSVTVYRRDLCMSVCQGWGEMDAGMIENTLSFVPRL